MLRLPLSQLTIFPSHNCRIVVSRAPEDQASGVRYAYRGEVRNLGIPSLPQADLGVEDRAFNVSRSATERAPGTVGRPSRTDIGVNAAK